MTEEEGRPDPDELLSRITAAEHEAEGREGRGQLKIFFGACAGVGKTYSMLSAAQQAHRDKIDVVIGLVETHGRQETQKLAEGIPVIPPKEINYRGTTLKEFDLDAALARDPDLVLLDELAHSNAPGSRHPKRWQDAQELLEAGIDVYTTLNVQHLESLNDVVARITGVWVKETVPDALFDRADEISLVDIPSEELLKRLKEGKVYIAPHAKKRAAQNFFRKGNLIALRELALRRTAERVDAQMDTYKTRTGTLQSWSGADRILVCIGPDTLSARLVRVTKRMANGLKAPWSALYIENDRHHNLSREAQDAVERTLRLAERMGGKTEIVTSNYRASDEIMAYAKAHGVTKIVVGKPTKSRWRDIVYGSLADELIRASGDIDVYVVTGGYEHPRSFRRPFWSARSPWQYYLSAPVMVAVCTLLLLPFRPYIESVNLVMAYMMGLVLIAVRYGRGPALLSSLLSVVSFNVFFIEPYYEFKLYTEQHITTFLVLLATGVVIGAQTAKLRQQAITARMREKNTAILYAMTRELTATRGKINLAQVVRRHIADVFESLVTIWLPDAAGQLQLVPMPGEESGEANLDHIREESVARWAYAHKQNAGRGTDTLPSARGFYLPLVASSGVVGALGVISSEDAPAFTTEQLSLIETFASQTAAALDRANVSEMAERTVIEAESEKLRNILLSSVSHDFRTPLASITAAASGLLMEGVQTGEERSREMLRSIHEEAARLARMVTNLLDVSSLESGSLKLNRELYFIEELVGSALMRTEEKLGGRRIVTEIEPGLPLVRIDGLLIEQVLINLLENAATYTPADATITISAKMVRPDIHVIVADNGPGIAAGQEERIFDKFYAAVKKPESSREEQYAGGMGLAICRGIVTAHGGKVWAQNAPGGGAVFTLTLPIKSSES